MTEHAASKTRSTIEIGAVIGIVVFMATLAFNAGIQYAQINALTLGLAATNTKVESNTADIRKIQVDGASDKAQILGSLSRIEQMIEDQQAARELKATGAMR